MKKKLTAKESIAITSMLFGMFFGAGNLIFPAKLGFDAGSNVFYAYLGMFITAVGLPLLAIVALALSRCDGVQSMASKVHPVYGKVFSILLYLTIGPLFAIPRCASTSFSVGIESLLPNVNSKVALAVFSFIFFIIVLFFSLKPHGIMTWIGKILNPSFLVVLAVLIVAAFADPISDISSLSPAEGYSTAGGAFFKGFIDGYGTLDALAGLAFGIIVVTVVRDRGIEKGDYVAASTAKAGILSCLSMGVIYFLITVAATKCSAILTDCTNGGEVLGTMSQHYFGSVGSILMTAIVTLACLKTAIGLVTSCSEAFVRMFPMGPTYKLWAIMICIVSFAIANLGLTTIVAYCIPVLMFLYPLAITITLLSLFSNFYHRNKYVYLITTAFTLVAALLDFVAALAPMLPEGKVVDVMTSITVFAGKCLPLFNLGLGWVYPAVLGFIIGMIADTVANGGHFKKRAGE